MGLFVRRDNTEKTLRGHLKELRNRLLACVIVLTAFGTIMYFFYEPILKVLSTTLGSPLYYSSPSGGFSFIMRICFTGAFIFTMPVIIYNIVMFVRPAYEMFLTSKRILIIALSSTILAISGAAFGFFCILPETIVFFSGFQVSGLSALISADEYLSFVTSIITVFVIVFQVPLLMGIIDSVKSISLKSMLKMEKWVILISVVIAIITPFNYDVLSSLLVAIPIIGLYNLSIIIILIRHKSKSYQNNLKIYSTIVKPEKNRPNTDPILDDSLIEELKFESNNQKRISPLSASRQNIQNPVKTNSRPRSIRTIDGVIIPNSPRPIAKPKNIRVFSDIIRRPKK